MTTYVDFAPPPRRPFDFQPTLDGQVYEAQCRFNLFSTTAKPRWYLHLYTLSGDLVCCVAVVGSPDAAVLADLAWDPLRQVVRAAYAAPHGLVLGSLADLTVSGVNPAAFNGRYRVAVVSPTAVEYPMPADPGTVVLPGAIGRDVDLVSGYFSTSTLVFRASSQQFEISP